MHAANQSLEESSIREVVAGFPKAWNRHDAGAIANLFTEDGDVVNVVGWWWQGRSQIERQIRDSHAFIFKESVLTHDEVHIRFLDPQVAVVHARWTLVGQMNPDRTPGQPRKGVATYVLHKPMEKWLIAAFQNTDSIPEMPFPTGR